MLTSQVMDAYIAILKEELVPAMGCTEPIAISYGAARLREVLGILPERIEADVSGNIIKNVKSVVVPNTGGLVGIEAAVAAGTVAGDAARELEVIASVTAEQQAQIKEYLKKTPIVVTCANTTRMLDITLTGYAGSHKAMVHIANNHTNVVHVEQDGEILLDMPVSDSPEENLTDKSVLNVRDIVTFANSVPLSEVRPLLERQVAYNTAIAEEGLRGDWGANVGKILLDDFPQNIKNEAKAYAAAGSDARMSGCELPVIILSGSGNQGLTATLPIVRYAKYLGVSQEKMYRALLVSDLVTIHQKTGIGRLSAFCGAVCAGTGAGAGVAYLHGGGYEAVAGTVLNSLGIISGTICDGAKASCAAKIAAAVESGILGYHMYLNHKGFRDGEGIIASDVDRTIQNVGVLAKEGMQETDHVILQIMTQQVENTKKKVENMREDENACKY